jgi:hypothetical protein
MTDKLKTVSQPKNWKLIVEKDVKMTIHAGGDETCYLLLPVIPARN